MHIKLSSLRFLPIQLGVTEAERLNTEHKASHAHCRAVRGLRLGSSGSNVHDMTPQLLHNRKIPSELRSVSYSFCVFYAHISPWYRSAVCPHNVVSFLGAVHFSDVLRSDAGVQNKKGDSTPSFDDSGRCTLGHVLGDSDGERSQYPQINGYKKACPKSTVTIPHAVYPFCLRAHTASPPHNSRIG